MNAEMEKLVAEICETESWLAGRGKDTRKNVIANGKKLAKLQKAQKKEQNEAKERGEEPQTWREFCEEQKTAKPSFPNPQDCTKYVLIAKYPAAYAADMSIKEAYREAGKWKKNGGNPPLPIKTTVVARHMVTLGRLAGKVHTKIEKLTNYGGFDTMQAFADSEEWDADELAGALDELRLARQSINWAIKELQEVDGYVEDSADDEVHQP